MDKFCIGSYEVGINCPPFIIAEMSGNHNQSLKKALAIVDAAADAGAHGLKIQTYTASTMTLDLNESGFLIEDKDNLWTGRSLYNLYEEAHTPWEWHPAILERAKKRGMVAFSSPFDISAVDFLEDLNVPCYKIASFENTDLELINRIAKTNKPLIMSTGISTISNIMDAIQIFRETSSAPLILLKCTSAYPSTPSQANILTIPHMQKLFQCFVGLSDHTSGIGVAIAAVSHGASIIEKHFTINRNDGGVDSTFSLEPQELKSLVVETKRAWESLGQVKYGVTEEEKPSKIFKRSLYIIENIKAGDTLTKKNIKSIRPGFGLSPIELDKVLGLKVNKNVKKGTPLTWELFK